MGCCGEREKLEDLRREQKWDYINLDDFKSTSCLTPFAYGYLLIMLLVSVSVYVVDIFTAVNLLVFDRWSGQISPKIPLYISRWIFAGCIILSLLLLFYRWLRAIRVMKQGGVAKSYLDPLAIRIQSIRMGGNGRGWKRFLVFAELTKSRKGADYVALFAHYSFEAWLRICFAEGPRQVVNAVTLYSVLQLQLLPTQEQAASQGHSAIAQFFVNIGILAESNKLQAVILFGMLWTLFIWVISVLSLLASVVLYLLFLWHHIPSDDGSLSKYCRNKINRRMERIVRVKVDKALKKENEIRARQDAMAARDGAGIKKQPTLPNLGDSLDPSPGLSRQTTMTTLPEYTSRPGTHNASNDTLPTMSTLGDMQYANRPNLKRSGTHASETSWSSYNSTAPLVNHRDVASPDYGRAMTPGSAGPGPNPSPWGARPSTGRSMTGNYSQNSYGPGLSRPGTAHSYRNGGGSYAMEPIPRPPTASSSTRRLTPPHDGFSVDNNLPNFEKPTSPGASSVLPYPLAPHERQQPRYDSQTPVPANSRHVPQAVDEQSRRSPFGGPLDGQTSARGFSERSNTPAGLLTENFTPSNFPPSRSMTPGYPNRSFTSTGPPIPRSMTPGNVERSNTPAGPPFPRSMTPGGPPERSFTPIGAPPMRSMTPGYSYDRPPSPFKQPTLPTLPMLHPLQTSGFDHTGGYGPLTAEPQSISPVSASGPLATSNYRNADRPMVPALQSRHQNDYGGSYRTDTSDADRQTSSRQDSGVDDILSHYR